MAGRFINMKNLKFTLHELIDIHKTPNLDPFAGRNKKSIDLVLDAALEFSKKALYPIFELMDRNPPELKNGTVAVNPEVRNIMQTLGRDGWIAAPFPEEWGGEEMPASILHAVYFIFAAANYSASVYSGLTTGAAKLIFTYGSDYLKKTFLPSMRDGKWQGTMALTEPEAGSSLGDLVTSARPMQQDELSTDEPAGKIFLISGEKIFISAGDHDGVDNVVHLLLARIEGSPAGVKGISLFVVPKFRPENLMSPKNMNQAETSYQQSKEYTKMVGNDVTVTQTFHKLGYRGAPITALSFGDKGDCWGWLVGEPNKGLSYMFQMMNGARLEVGMGATSIASAAYEAALDYTKTRKQGRSLSGDKQNKRKNQPVPIIEHPDVKRMLLFQRSVWEGSLSLILQCSIYEDIVKSLSRDLMKNSSDLSEIELINIKDEKEKYHLLLELLTPVAKTFPSEMGILSTSQSLQCFGGYGYCEDFPVEQHFRDMRIHAIHEGTTGIQGMDILGRKVVMQDGKALKLFCHEVEKTVEKALSHKDLDSMAYEMRQALKTVTDTTQTLGIMAMQKGAEAFLANATLYLEMFGYVVIAWQWLSQSLMAVKKLSDNPDISIFNTDYSSSDTKKSDVINKSDRLFYEGKIMVCRYFFYHELPKIKHLEYTLTRDIPITISIQTDHFTS
ncbi:MAG: acyl-CoA dehydrogenase [Desulfamplus sp.]|nr:acyl-CoA dehydrogenase [Desulfamplus sp.]